MNQMKTCRDSLHLDLSHLTHKAVGKAIAGRTNAQEVKSRAVIGTDKANNRRSLDSTTRETTLLLIEHHRSHLEKCLHESTRRGRHILKKISNRKPTEG